MLFASALQRSSIQNCRIIISDGTFELAPKPFKQIFTIHGLFNWKDKAEWIPLAFALMKRR